jgi:hypothetical protein
MGFVAGKGKKSKNEYGICENGNKETTKEMTKGKCVKKRLYSFLLEVDEDEKEEKAEMVQLCRIL